MIEFGVVRATNGPNMHELFTKVLSRKDLSRAGDLFSVADAEIVIDLSDVVCCLILFYNLIVI